MLALSARHGSTASLQRLDLRYPELSRKQLVGSLPRRGIVGPGHDHELVQREPAGLLLERCCGHVRLPDKSSPAHVFDAYPFDFAVWMTYRFLSRHQGRAQ